MLLKEAQDLYTSYIADSTNGERLGDQNLLNQRIAFFKEAIKADGLSKADYGLSLVAFVLHETKIVHSDGEGMLKKFFEQNELSDEQETEIREYLKFLESERDEENLVEEILRDTQYIHLGMPDTLEKLEMLRRREDEVKGLKYSDADWVDKCKEHFIKHSFNCAYTIKNFGNARSRNFIELEKRADKINSSPKEKNGNGKSSSSEILSDKEGEEMFKLAFRNSVNLISVADSKAGMLIQINTLLAGFVFTLGVAKFDDNPYYLVPTSAILIGSALTVFFGILASRPVKRELDDNPEDDKIGFFFGSYDRLDTEARKISWEKYSTDMNELLAGNKKNVFEGLIRESYEVSKVLSRKFGYLSLAYKIFFAGLLIGILGFLVLIIYEYNSVTEHTHGVINGNPF